MSVADTVFGACAVCGCDLDTPGTDWCEACSDAWCDRDDDRDDDQ